MLTSSEFAELLAYEAICPHGELRADLRAGIVASTIANANRAKRTQAFVPRDFMPEFDEASKNPDYGKLARDLQLFTVMNGGVVING